MESTGVQPAVAAPEQVVYTEPATVRQIIERRWADLGLVLLITIVPLILNAGYLMVHPVRAGAATNFRFSVGLLQEFAGVVLLVYVIRRQGRTLDAVGLNFHWTDLLKGLLLAFAALVASTVFSILVRKFSILLMDKPADMRDPRVIFAGAAPALLAVYGIGSSIFEELIVRGYLMNELVALASPVWVAAVASVVIQTSYHLYYGLAGALAISGMFTAFAVYFSWSRRLAPVILAHMYVDLLATFASR